MSGHGTGHSALAGTERRFPLPTQRTTVPVHANTLRDSLAASAAGRLLKRARQVPERVLHPFRRRSAVDLLRRTDRPRSVVFVCLGNICRSPYAAAAFARALPTGVPRVSSRSAGLIGPNRPCPPEAIRAAARRGIDLTAHRSVLLDRDLVRGSDLVVVLAAEQKPVVCREYRLAGRHVLVLGDLDPLPARSRTILDPWRQPAEIFEASYTRIDRCVAELARALRDGDPQPVRTAAVEAATG